MRNLIDIESGNMLPDFFIGGLRKPWPLQGRIEEDAAGLEATNSISPNRRPSRVSGGLQRVEWGFKWSRN